MPNIFLRYEAFARSGFFARHALAYAAFASLFPCKTPDETGADQYQLSGPIGLFWSLRRSWYLGLGRSPTSATNAQKSFHLGSRPGRRVPTQVSFSGCELRLPQSDGRPQSTLPCRFSLR